MFRGTTAVPEQRSHQLYFGRVIDPESEETVDQVLAVTMLSPHSYTGDDVVEIHAHGGQAVVDRILACCLASGARLAHPGEFTQRAFLNGRLDLAQAESVAELIQARSQAAARLAGANLEGHLSTRVSELREKILTWMTLLEAEIDFGEDIDELSPLDQRERLLDCKEDLDKLIAGGHTGRRIQKGLVVVLTGPPNAGKSTFLNTVLGVDRALVTEVAGTTRDRLEEDCSLDGIPLRVVDTAGLRASTSDAIERLGMERSREALMGADLVVVMLDQSQPYPADFEFVAESGQRTLVVLNKKDLGQAFDAEEVRQRLGAEELISVSLLNAQDKRSALEFLARHARNCLGTVTERVSVNDRHLEALYRCRESLDRVGGAIEQELSVEFLCLDLRQATQALGEIVGLDVSEAILDKIFSSFCLGK